MEEKKSVISKNSLMPISFVLVILAGVFFIAQLSARVDYIGEELKLVRQDIRSMMSLTINR